MTGIMHSLKGGKLLPRQVCGQDPDVYCKCRLQLGRGEIDLAKICFQMEIKHPKQLVSALEVGLYRTGNVALTGVRLIRG